MVEIKGTVKILGDIITETQQEIVDRVNLGQEIPQGYRVKERKIYQWLDSVEDQYGIKLMKQVEKKRTVEDITADLRELGLKHKEIDELKVIAARTFSIEEDL